MPAPEDLSLASFFHRRGRLSEETLRSALAATSPGRPLATVLLERGLLAPGELAEVGQISSGGRTWADPGSRAEGGRHEADETWGVGSRIGPYLIDEELGRGGMGVVYLASEGESGAKVAIKTLLSGASEAAKKRFVREGQAQAAVDEHPNVLRIRSAGEIAGRAYLVMDFAPGGDLEHRVRGGPLPPFEAARIARDVAHGLAHVHARGVLHRDLKPANVLFDEDGNPRLVDFGLAKIEGAEKLTATGTMLGTPAYMAPEQTGGEKVDARADVYGLGAMLYHMLTGRVPFEGSGPEVITKVLTAMPDAPSKIVPAVPDSLDRITLKCLAKEPAKRYHSAESLARDLDRAISGSSVEAEAAPRSRRPLLAIPLVVPVLFAAAWQLRPAPPPPPVEPTTAAVTTTPARPRDPLDSPTWGLPAVSRRYRFQWHDDLPTGAFRHILATLELGPAEATNGVVRCAGRLSELIILSGDDTAYGGHAFEDATFALAISITESPFDVRVEGVDGRKQPLLESIPANERYARDSDDMSKFDEGAAWTGSTLMRMFTNRFVGEMLATALPRACRKKHGLRAVLVDRGGYNCHATLDRLLFPLDDVLSKGVRFEATWRVDADGTLERAEFTETATAANTEKRRQTCSARCQLGPAGSFPERTK